MPPRAFALSKAWPRFTVKSAVGHSRRLDAVRAMSALRPIAAVEPTSSIGGFVPQADICGAANEALFDHLVGERQQGGWNCKAECFSGLQVDEKVELARLHYG